METTLTKYININGQLMDLSHPQVMGILNVTPDSFYAQSRQQTEEGILSRVHQILEEGGNIIDIGAYSSRPNADHISTEEETKRLRHALSLIIREYPQAVLSVDTFRADIARMCVEEYGVAIINDISAGNMDAQMFSTIARLGVPYILMHMQGTPQNMQQHPHYEHIVQEVLYYFSEKVQQLRDLGAKDLILDSGFGFGKTFDLGAKDLILDSGFGFGKTLEHNYELLNQLEEFQIFNLPLLVGVSRKSMIYKLLGGGPEDALNGTTAIHAISLQKGANILRVHDVKAATEVVRIMAAMQKNIKPSCQPSKNQE